MKPPELPDHDRFHAHVYFDDASADQAARLTERAAERFALKLGRLHPKPIGPHPRGSRQLAFDAGVYRELVAWLDANRGELTVLVHGDSGDDLADHTEHAWWLGEPETLDLDMFRR